MASAVLDLGRAVPQQRTGERPGQDSPPADLAGELASLVPGARPVSFRSRWWDGAAWTPVLIAEIDGVRRRLVPAGEQVLVLPAAGGAARRAMREWRDGLSALPALPAPLPADPAESVTRLVVLPGRRRPGTAAR